MIIDGSTWSNRVIYVKKKSKDENPSANKTKRSNVFLQADVLTVESDLLFLKHAIIKDQSPVVIREKLESTRKLREEMCDKLDTDYREQFPFFFTNPELVSNMF